MTCHNSGKMSFLMFQRVLNVLLLYIWMTGGTVIAIKWRVEPRDQVVFEGSSITLTCALPSLSVSGDIIHWLFTPDGSNQQIFLSTNNRLSSALTSSKVDRYNVQSRSSKFQLLIYNSDSTDKGEYACMIYNKLATRRALSGYARVDVVPSTLPENSPACSITPMHPQPGDQVYFTCTSLAGSPVSTLTWSRGNVVLPSTTSILQESRQKTVTFSKTLTGTDNHAEYVCSENWPITESVTSYCRISPFDVPINVSIIPHHVELSAADIGKGITFTCNAKSYPPSVRYKWFFDGLLVTQQPDRFEVLNEGESLRIINLTFDPERNFDRNPMEVRCNVVNSVGEMRSAKALLRIFSRDRGAATRVTKEGRGKGANTSEGDGQRRESGNQGRRLDRLLLTLTIISSVILCLLIGMLVKCSRQRSKSFGIHDGDSEDASNILDIVEISSPIASVTSSVEYSKPRKAGSHKRPSSYTPLFKEGGNTENPSQSHEIVDPVASTSRQMLTDSIYENATRFSLPELPGLPLSRFDGRLCKTKKQNKISV